MLAGPVLWPNLAICTVFTVRLSKSFTANNLADAFHFSLCLRKEIIIFSKQCLQPLSANAFVLQPAV